jgi:hypothetical protein
MEEVEEHMAQLYGEEDAAITATYEQFFQKIVRTRPHAFNLATFFLVFFKYFYIYISTFLISTRPRNAYARDTRASLW